MFRSFSLLLILSSLLSLRSFGQCSETDVTRVLLLGDSWAQFMNTDNTIQTTFERWGHSNYTFYSNANLSVNGTQTGDFLTPARLTEIQNQLASHPDIDLVHLSLGGNDVLGNWDVSFTQAQTDSLLDSVYTRLTTLIDFIKAQRPGIRILWSGYAYPNFGEIIGELSNPSSHPFYATWQGMGFPTFTQLNGILNYYSSVMDTLAANDPQVDFVRATGLMQYYYGQTTPLGVPPGTSYPAFTAPLSDGYPDMPSPKSSMRNYIFFRDCFHLSAAAYGVFLDYHTQKFYHKALMDDQYFLSEGGIRDGAVSSAGNISTQLLLGNNGTEDYASVLSFNTASMPDTGVSKAAVFLRRESLTGTNPMGNPANLQMKIIRGAFSLSADLEVSDYSAQGNAVDVPCRFGSYANNGEWVRLELPQSLLPYIGNDTLTQIIISASGASGITEFTGAVNPELAPVLNVKYGPSVTTGLSQINSEAALMLYPNPTTGIVMLSSANAEVIDISVFSTSGQLLKSPSPQQGTFDISDLPTGMYLVRITTEKGVTSKLLVRK